MSDDEMTRFLVLLADFQSLKEDGAIWLSLGFAEVASATSKLAAMFDETYAEMDEVFWELAGHYDNGWDILREAGQSA